MRRALVFSLLLAAAVLAGCSSGHSSATPTITTVATVATPTTFNAGACQTERSTFTTAVNAYKAQHDNQVPPGNDASAILRTLESPAAGILKAGFGQYYDPASPPAPSHWTWNASAGKTVGGTGCGANN